MPQCRICHGEGYEDYEEDGRMVHDACYHCSTTGQVDEDMDWHDRLMAAAETMGRYEEQEYRSACNDDPLGDGYDLCAAENGMSSGDYFRSRVYDRGYELGAKFADLPIHDQTVLIGIYEGWGQTPWAEPTWQEALKEMLPEDLKPTLGDFGRELMVDTALLNGPDDEIPF